MDRSFIFHDPGDGQTHRATLLTRRGVTFVQSQCGLQRTWNVQVMPGETSITCATCQQAVVFTPRLYVPGRRR